MTTAVGRIREDSALENEVKWVLLSHNSKLGAANGAPFQLPDARSKRA